MLILSRKVGETIVIDDRMTITITRIAGNRVSIGINAPPGMRIVRGELEPLDQAPAPKSRLGEPRFSGPTGLSAPEQTGENGYLNHVIPAPH